MGFFFLLVATITIVCRIPIHPMHYLFVAGGFFAFHFLLAYLVDHISMSKSFAIAAIVSCALNGTYLRSALVENSPSPPVSVAKDFSSYSLVIPSSSPGSPA